MFQDNEQQKSRWESLKERLRHTYRLVIMNDETFEEVGSYRINLLNVYILISTELVVVAFMVYAAYVNTEFYPLSIRADFMSGRAIKMQN